MLDLVCRYASPVNGGVSVPRQGTQSGLRSDSETAPTRHPGEAKKTINGKSECVVSAGLVAGCFRRRPRDRDGVGRDTPNCGAARTYYTNRDRYARIQRAQTASNRSERKTAVMEEATQGLRSPVRLRLLSPGSLGYPTPMPLPACLSIWWRLYRHWHGRRRSGHPDHRHCAVGGAPQGVTAIKETRLNGSPPAAGTAASSNRTRLAWPAIWLLRDRLFDSGCCSRVAFHRRLRWPLANPSGVTSSTVYGHSFVLVRP